MLYQILLFLIRMALKIFCVSIKVYNKTALHQKGPLLIVANHPDSFFDALVIAANCKYPVSFLARGDVFTKPWHNFLLRALNMMPVYRQREGKEHLHKNQNSVDASVAVFKNGLFLQASIKAKVSLAFFRVNGSKTDDFRSIESSAS